jgi:poly-D-alanine transfer protein DltD
MQVTQKGTKRQRQFQYCVVKFRITRSGGTEVEVVGNFFRETDAQKWVLNAVTHPNSRGWLYGITKMIDPYPKGRVKAAAEEVAS